MINSKNDYHYVTVKLPLGSKCKQDNADLYKQFEYTAKLYRSACNMFSRLVRENNIELSVSLSSIQRFYKDVREAHPELPSNLVDAAKRHVIESYTSRKSNIRRVYSILDKTNNKFVKARMTKQLNNLLKSYPSFDKTTVRMPHINAYTFRYDKRYLSLSVASSSEDFRVKPIYRICDYYRKNHLDDHPDFEVGEARLIHKSGKWELHISVRYPRSTQVHHEPTVLGVDLGINNIAATYNTITKESYVVDGTDLISSLEKTDDQIARLQARGSRSAYRRVAGLRSCNRAMVKHTLHQVSKQIVKSAKDAGCAYILMEDLKNIRDTAIHRKSMNRKIHTWKFHELQCYVEYKAAMAGVNVRYVDPAYTSRTCSVCGSKHVRRIKHSFTCHSCGHTDHADINAAKNIAMSLVLGRAAATNKLIKALR